MTNGAGNLAEPFEDSPRPVKEQARDETVALVHRAQDRLARLVARQKEEAAGRLGDLAGALRDAARQLDQKDAAGFGRYAHRTAEQVDRAARYLRGKDLRALARDTETFARQNPELFLGGSLVAGVLLARFLKSSAERREPWQSRAVERGAYQEQGDPAVAGGL